MSKRFMTGLIGAPVVIAAIIYGGIPFLAVVAFIGLVGSYEFWRLTAAKGIEAHFLMIAFGTLLTIFSAYFGGLDAVGASIGLILVVNLAYQLINKAVSGAIQNPSASFFGSVYLGWTLGALLLLRNMGGDSIGRAYVLTVFAVTWANDIFAFLIGIKFGRNKLCPNVSPKKSVEGAVGGLLFSIITAMLLNRLDSLIENWPSIPMIDAVILGILISIGAQFGDLFESMFKRDAGVKDSGSLFPGHGGVLDRFDAMFISATLAFFYIKYLLTL